MILDIQPVSHLHAVSVNRELLVMLDVIDHQRDQLLRELIRAVVVGAAGDVDRHAVGVVERLNKVIRARLRSRVRAVWIDGRRLHEIPFRAQRAVDLIGGHLQILLARLPALGFRLIPRLLGALEQVHRAHDIRLHKDFRVRNRTIHVRLRRKVDDAVKVVFFKQRRHQFLVADIALHKDVALIPFHALQVLQIAGIRQLVQIDQENIVVLFEHVIYEVRSDKTRAAGDQIRFHLFSPIASMYFPSSTSFRYWPY